MAILEQIEKASEELKRCKPRSMRHAELQARLKELRLKQLRSEIRMKKRVAA